MKKILFLVSLLALFVLSCGAKASKDKNVIKVGVIGALTGNVAQYGTSTINGFKLKVKEINAAGGINGKKIEIVEADSSLQPLDIIRINWLNNNIVGELSSNNIPRDELTEIKTTDEHSNHK